MIPQDRRKRTGSLWLPNKPFERETTALESDQLWLDALIRVLRHGGYGDAHHRGDRNDRTSATHDILPSMRRGAPTDTGDLIPSDAAALPSPAMNVRRFIE
jgi:hypothetical protein